MWIYILRVRDFSDLSGWKNINTFFSTESKAKAFVKEANEPYDSKQPNYSYCKAWAE